MKVIKTIDGQFPINIKLNNGSIQKLTAMAAKELALELLKNLGEGKAGTGYARLSARAIAQKLDRYDIVGGYEPYITKQADGDYIKYDDMIRILSE